MPNPVARVAGAPPAPPTAAAPSPPPAAGGLAGLSRNQLYIGAAVLVAGFAALSALKGKKADAGDGTMTYEMDTTFSDIQSNFDQLNDKLDQYNDVPRPGVVTPPVVTPPVVVKPAPKPAPPRTSVRYIVKTGDTIAKIAALYRASPSNIYGLNKGVIDAAAAAHGKRTHTTATTIYPGMVLTVPWGQPGQSGSPASVAQAAKK
jgi:LysM repeat protein